MEFSSANEGNTSSSQNVGSKSSDDSEFCEDCTNPATSTPEQPPNKKMRRTSPNTEKASRSRVDRAIAATREFIRQTTTNLSQKEKAEVERNIHGRERAKEIALGDAVIESIREFHVWCRNDPVLSNEGRLQAERIVGMATLPMSDGRFDRLYSQKTGVDRKKIDDVRDRRANVAKHHLTEEGIFGADRQSRGNFIPWDMQKKAMDFWMHQTAPRNKGAGEKMKV
jgi:hypothetical protein